MISRRPLASLTKLQMSPFINTQIIRVFLNQIEGQFERMSDSFTFKAVHPELVFKKLEYINIRKAIEYDIISAKITTLHWRHNDHGGVSNHQPRGCLLNRLFRRRWKKTSKLRVTGLCAGNSPGPVNYPHEGPVTRKMFPFDDVIMHMAHLELQANVLALYISIG